MMRTTSKYIRKLSFLFFISFFLLFTFMNVVQWLNEPQCETNGITANILNQDHILSSTSTPIPIIYSTSTTTTTTTTTITTTIKLRQTYDYNKVYPQLISCTKTYSQPWDPSQIFLPHLPLKAYTETASNETHSFRITRALIFFFPIYQVDHFVLEFKWLYRSWTEMQKYEPRMWRTDMIVFVENDEKALSANLLFSKMNCSFKNVRTNEYDEPMCTLVEFVPLQRRNLTQPDPRTQSFTDDGV